jgi:hypothetical protein
MRAENVVSINGDVLDKTQKRWNVEGLKVLRDKP